MPPVVGPLAPDWNYGADGWVCRNCGKPWASQEGPQPTPALDALLDNAPWRDENEGCSHHYGNLTYPCSCTVPVEEVRAALAADLRVPQEAEGLDARVPSASQESEGSPSASAALAEALLVVMPDRYRMNSKVAGVPVGEAMARHEANRILALAAKSAAVGIREWMERLSDFPPKGRKWWHGPPWLRQERP
jgi:hypothetical protein